MLAGGGDVQQSKNSQHSLLSSILNNYRFLYHWSMFLTHLAAGPKFYVWSLTQFSVTFLYIPGLQGVSILRARNWGTKKNAFLSESMAMALFSAVWWLGKPTHQIN